MGLFLNWKVEMQIFISFFIYVIFLEQILSAQNSCVVFMYHRFGEDKYPSTNITIKQFENHLRYIKNNGFKVWPLSKIVRYIKDGREFPNKTVAITVDDAYISTYTKAYPMLKAEKFPFTVFVSTNAVDSGSKNYMNWHQMREMSKYGVEFANHSLTHHYLLRAKDETKVQWAERFKSEVDGAQKRLHEELGILTNENPKLFSYPFGEYNEEMMEMLKSLEYVGVTQLSGAIDADTDLKELPRFAMAEIFGDIKDFALKIGTLPLPVESVIPKEPLIILQNPPVLRVKLKEVVKNIGCYKADGEKIKMKWLSDIEFLIYSSTPLKAPRDRYTCTAPSISGRWYWYSHMWIIK